MLARKILLCFILFISGNPILVAQSSSLIIGGELRPRFILDNGYKTPKPSNEDPQMYTTQRTRLNVHFLNKNIESYISLQDIRVWGNDNNFKSSGVYGNTESTSLHQGWIKLILNKSISAKIGRQIFSYDDQRILSVRNWNDYQVTYNAILIELKDSTNQFNVGLSYNAETNTSTFYPETKFKLYDFIRYERQFNKLNLSIIGVLTGNTLTDSTKSIYLRGTYGTNLKYKSKYFNARTALYYQHHLNDIGPKTSAFCFSFFIQKHLFINRLSLGVGFDYLSGNDDININADYAATQHQFDILYGRRHGWYGHMDYYSTTPMQGLQDYMVKLKYNPEETLSLSLDYHYFKLAEHKLDEHHPELCLNKQLGQELDFKLTWQFHKEAQLRCGYSFYLMTETFKQIKNVEQYDLRFPQFTYFMLTVKPSILIPLKRSF